MYFLIAFVIHTVTLWQYHMQYPFQNSENYRTNKDGDKEWACCICGKWVKEKKES